MRYLLTLFSVIGILSFSGYGQMASGGKVAFGIRGGVSTYFGSIEERSLKEHYAFSVDYWLTNLYSIGFEIGSARLDGQDDNGAFNSNTHYFMTDIKLKLLQDCRLHPYLLTGLEMIRLSIKDPSGRDIPPNRVITFDQFKPAIPVGMGISYYFSPNVSFDMQTVYHFAALNYADNFSKPSDGDDDFMTSNMGLSVYFGNENGDRDGDGIPDVVDICPDDPEDIDGFDDDDGCPDLDNDEDGISDAVDDCPNEPEDMDGFQDADGCPDTDNDADGLPDFRDRCPGTDVTLVGGINTKEDMDGYKDSDGCPDLDNDGDGIPDESDLCPNAPETFNGYEDADGCPDEKLGILQKPLVLNSVYFRFDRADLDPNSREILDQVAEAFAGNPNVRIVIRGYTDTIGTWEYNIWLSKRRAENVKRYLVRKGIDASRISTIGRGPQNPVASNMTAEGRAQNRRIEIERTQ